MSLLILSFFCYSIISQYRRLDLNNRTIYIVKQDGSNYYKIGRSKSIKTRLAAIQNGNPHEIVLIATISDIGRFGVSIEQRLHHLLKSRRIRGEWFELPELSNAPLRTISMFLLQSDFVLMDATHKENHYQIMVEYKRRPRSNRGNEEVDASIIMLLESKQILCDRGVGMREIAFSLSQYYRYDFILSLERLVKKGYVYSSKTKRGKLFWLKSKIGVGI